MIGRWPLRVRVSLAFLAATALAVVLLAVFVQARVGTTLDQRTRDQLEVELNGLAEFPEAARTERVEAMTGEVHAQVISAEGTVVASSPLVAERLVAPDDVGATPVYSERDVTVYDDDRAAVGVRARETESMAVLTQRVDDQVIAVAASREDSGEAVASVQRQLLIGGPVVLVLASVLGYLIAKLGLRPIEQMRARASTISDDSSGERLPVPVARDELRRLALTLNAMLDRLDDGLQRQRHFVAEASHELRTPLALLRTEVDLALDGNRSPIELRTALASARDETIRLTTLVEDLLTLAAADEGRLVRASEQVELTDLAREAVRRFAAGASPRVVRAAAKGPAVVRGDAERLAQVVANLIDNALRHGAGDVVVRVFTKSDHAVIQVSDEGAGFTVDNPFDRFTGSQVSSGLGLAIVQEITSAHDGTVVLGREAGRTVVTVSFPSPTTQSRHQADQE